MPKLIHLIAEQQQIFQLSLGLEIKALSQIKGLNSAIQLMFKGLIGMLEFIKVGIKMRKTLMNYQKMYQVMRRMRIIKKVMITIILKLNFDSE